MTDSIVGYSLAFVFICIGIFLLVAAYYISIDTVNNIEISKQNNAHRVMEVRNK